MRTVIAEGRRVCAKTSVLTVSDRMLTPFQAIRECKGKMPRFRDILPLSQFKEKDARASGIVKDINALVVTAELHVQFGTFYFYNKANTPMGDIISADESVRIEVRDRDMSNIGNKLMEKGVISDYLDNDVRADIRCMNSTEGAPLQAAGYLRHSVEILPTGRRSKLRRITQLAMKTGSSRPFVLEGKEYTFRKGVDGLVITRESRNVLHVPKEFQDMENVIVVCDVRNVPMKIWEADGATHGEFKTAKGMEAMRMFYQSGSCVYQLAMDNKFHLPVSRKKEPDEGGMNTFTRKADEGAAFGLASIFWGIPVGCPFADVSNPGYNDYHTLIWQ